MAFIPEWVEPNSPPAVDPKQLFIQTPGTQKTDGTFFKNNAFPHAVKTEVDSKNFLVGLQNTLIAQSKAAGNGKPATLHEVIIDTHGRAGNLDPSHWIDETEVSLSQTLDAIGKAQQTLRRQKGVDPHIKIADRVVITGCSTLANPSNEDIARYSLQAQKLGIDVIASYDAVETPQNGSMSGRYVKFGKDGSFHYDKYDSPTVYVNHTNEKVPAPVTGYGEWMGCYEGRSLKEGAACHDAPAILSAMFKTAGTATLENGTPQEQALAADMKKIVQEYDGGNDVIPADPSKADEMRKLAEDTGKRLSDYLKENPHSKMAQHFRKDINLDPAEAARQIDKQIESAKLDRLSQASGTPTHLAAVSGGAPTDASPASGLYAGQNNSKDKSNQVG